MTSNIFDICRGAIPGSRQLLQPFSREVVAFVGGVAIVSALGQKALKSLSSDTSQNSPLPETLRQRWSRFKLLTSLKSLQNRKVAMGAVGLFLTACVIALFQRYVRLFFSLPFTTPSLVIEFTQWSNRSITALIGVGVLVGTKVITSCFGIHVFRLPSDALNHVRVRFFGPKNQTRDKKSGSLLWESFPQKRMQKSTFFNFGKKLYRVLIPTSPEATGVLALPEEILQNRILPLAINETEDFKTFQSVLLTCKRLLALLLDSNCLIPPAPQRHFLWKPFRLKNFDPVEVTAFFHRYLPRDHQGEGLRLPFRYLDCVLKNSVTPSQLSHICSLFPKASIDSLVVRLGTEDPMEEVAVLLNNYLEPHKKMFCLTIVCDSIRYPDESTLYGKILTQSEYDERHYFECEWKYKKLQRNYPDQLMKLLHLLKGQVQVLRIDFTRNSDDSKLDPVPIIQLFKIFDEEASEKPALIVHGLHFDMDDNSCASPRPGQEKVRALIKNDGSRLNRPPPPPATSLIDETLLIKNSPIQDLEIIRAPYLG